MTRTRNAVEKTSKLSHVSQSLSQSQSQQRKKAPKGTVSVQVFKDRLRLCWSYHGKRYFLYVGLPDSKINRVVAEQKARQIEGDMATGNFDPSLRKYKPEYQQHQCISVTKLFERFMEQKAKDVTPKTMEKYRATLGYLKRFFKDVAAEAVTSSNSEGFARHLNGEGLAPNQCKRRIEELKACWNWAIAKNAIASNNPWTEVAERIKVSPKQKPKPFSKEEIKAIVQAFRTDPYYSHYTDYVEFLFGTGV